MAKASLFQMALYRVELMENLELAMLTIVQTMAIGEFYHQIYTSSWSMPMLGSPVTAQAFREMFDTALHELYRSIQEFIDKARKYIDPDVSGEKYHQPDTLIIVLIKIIIYTSFHKIWKSV